MQYGTIAGTKPALSSPTSPLRWAATTYGPRSRNFSLVADDQLLEPKPFGFALHQRRPRLPKLDRTGDDARVKRCIIGPQFLDRPGAVDAPGDARRQHFE